jgi:CHAT domain-containing protein
LQADIGLANVYSQQRQGQAAAALYTEVLARAEHLGAARTQAIVERNLGSLSLDQGQYADALRYLEQSRRRYARLDLPHEEALAERELADVYLELNLIPEAIAIYTSLAPVLASLKMSFELAWTRAHHGRAALLGGQFETARPLLAEARELFAAAGNEVCVAFVLILEAQRLYGLAAYAATAPVAAQAARMLAAGGPLSWLIFAQWLAGDAARLAGDTPAAQSSLRTAHTLAQQHALPQIGYRCATSLGLLALSNDNREEARAIFTQAVALIETLRSPLPADDFRTAFFIDKRTPYSELARLCLEDTAPDQTIEGLRYVEQARARALTDLLSGAPAHDPASDSATSMLQASRAEHRAQLNAIYNQITRTFATDDPDQLQYLDSLQDDARRCEEAILTLTRQIRQYGNQPGAGHPAPAHEGALLDIAAFQRTLEPGQIVISYSALDDEVIAFVVTHQTVQAVRHLGSLAAVEAAVEQVRFQMDTFRHGAAQMRGHTRQLTRRVQRYLAQLYAILIHPLERLLDGERVIVVPHGMMHYIPFAALYDGSHYLIERYEISVTPGIGVLQQSRGRQQHPSRRQAVLVGVPDEHAPQVRAEVEHLVDVFPESTILLGHEATVTQVQSLFEHADVLHLACHGHFRPDNPLFSALRLADGWLTVQDMETVRLRCRLVTLSACETGVSAIAPGDELLGLVRGFLSAGAQNLLVSLWTVDDAATTRLMQTFYRSFCAGAHPATALRTAQCSLLAEYPHPFFWSPFVLL